jgi:ComF family protein
VAGSVAALDYTFPWDRLIQAFKFGHQPDLAGVLAQSMLAAVCAHRHHGKDAVDALVPVPLWPGRLADRGYNQSWELARRLARWTGKPGRADILVRTRATAVQSLIKASERAANIRGAIVAAPEARRWIAGRRIGLVDDVMTSGATAFEAARALRDAGAAEVRLWVLARAHGVAHDR